MLVPEKVKHIHHHHVKKVYLKPRPAQYIEDDDYGLGLQRAGEEHPASLEQDAGAGEDFSGGPSGPGGEDDDKVLAPVPWGLKLKHAKAQVTRSFETPVSTTHASWPTPVLHCGQRILGT